MSANLTSAISGSVSKSPNSHPFEPDEEEEVEEEEVEVEEDVELASSSSISCVVKFFSSSFSFTEGTAKATCSRSFSTGKVIR